MLDLAVVWAVASLSAAGCPSDPDRSLLSLHYEAFDTSTTEMAWRALLNRGCVDAAVATLKAYQTANARRMTTEQKEESNFHVGQALAMSGREPESAPYFAASAGPTSTPLWSAYVEATLGFVRKDRQQLGRALSAYEMGAAPNSMRLRIIRGLLRCFYRPYRDAMHCGMQGPLEPSGW